MVPKPPERPWHSMCAVLPCLPSNNRGVPRLQLTIKKTSYPHNVPAAFMLAWRVVSECHAIRSVLVKKYLR